MIALALIPKGDRAVTTCCKCGKTIDLTGGGLYFYDVTWKRPRPVCPWCTAPKSPQVSLAGALYAQAAMHFNELNPEHAANFAIIQTLDAIKDADLPADPELANEAESGAQLVT